MPIPKEKIEEYRRLADRWWFRGKHIGNMQEGLAALLSEREALLSLLREVEWVSDRDGASPEDDRCPDPRCRSERREGHAEGCRLKAAIG